MDKAHAKKHNPAWPLIFVTHAAAGLFFAYETAGSLAPDLANEMGFSSHQIGLLFSAYSIPAIIMVSLNGYLHKRFGPPKCTVLLSFIIATGTTLVAIAPNFPLMFIGQLIYGAGSSPMFLTATLITGKWFGTDATGKRKLSIGLGLQFSWLRLLSFVSLFVLPIIAKNYNFRISMWFSALVCWSSFFSGLLFFLIVRHYRYAINVFDDDEGVELSHLTTTATATATTTTTTGHINVPEEDNLLSVKSISILEEEAKLERENKENSANMVSQDEEDKQWLVDNAAEPTVSSNTANKKWYSLLFNTIGVVREFSVSYWLVLLLMVIFISDLYTCTAFLTKFLYEQLTAEHPDASSDEKTEFAVKASAITSLVCLSNVITSPICGWLSGVTGWRVKCVILGSINLVLIHTLFTFETKAPPYILASALGLTQSIMDTNMWPCLIFTVSKKHYPFAMSLVTMSYNVGLIVFPIVCGFLQDLTHTWLSVNLAFIVFSSFSVILSLALKYVDVRNGDVLDLPLLKRPTKAIA